MNLCFQRLAPREQDLLGLVHGLLENGHITPVSMTCARASQVCFCFQAASSSLEVMVLRQNVVLLSAYAEYCDGARNARC